MINGNLDSNYNGLVLHVDGNWYYVKNGMIDWNVTALVPHNGVWYYVENGCLNWSYNGIAGTESMVDSSMF